MLDIDAPYDQLDALPRELWLPAVITAAGHPDSRLAHLAQWRVVLDAGELPAEQLDFGDPQAVRPMLAVVGELGLPALCKGAPPLVLQVLRTLLWHLDRINDHLPAMRRADAITQEVQGFRAEWELQRSGWEEVRSLMLGLGELANMSWDESAWHAAVARVARSAAHQRAAGSLATPGRTDPRAGPHTTPTATTTGRQRSTAAHPRHAASART